MENQNNIKKFKMLLREKETKDKYISTLREILIEDMSLFNLICEEFDLKEEELISILLFNKNISYSTLDLIVDFALRKRNIKILKLKNNNFNSN